MNALACVMAAEWFKVLRKRRTYILAALWWVVLPVVALIVGQVAYRTLATDFAQGVSPTAAREAAQAIASAYGIARLHLMLPALLSPTFYMIVLALLAALFIGEERTQNTWKATLTAQPSRLAVLGGKFAVAMLVYGLLLFGGYALSFIYGAIGSLFLPTSLAGDWLRLFGLYALQWAFGATGMLFAFVLIWLLRSVALGLIGIFFLPALLEGLYSVYATVVGFEPLNRLNVLFQALRLRQTLENLPRYFFTSNLYAPARAPLRELASALGGEAGDFGPFGGLLGSGLTLSHAALVMLGYGLAFAALLLASFLQRDIS